MKKIFVIILVVTMLALSVIPALAAGGPPAERGSGNGTCIGNPAGTGSQTQARYGMMPQGSGFGTQTPYAISGTITAIDPIALTVIVKVSCGNRLASSTIGNDVTLKTSDATRFLLRNEDGTVTPITFAGLKVNETISSHGTLDDGIFTATRVTMGALLNCLP